MGLIQSQNSSKRGNKIESVTKQHNCQLNRGKILTSTSYTSTFNNEQAASFILKPTYLNSNVQPFSQVSLPKKKTDFYSDCKFIMTMINVLQFSMTETIITGVYDQFEDFMKQNKKRLYLFRTFVCFMFFVLGLPLTTKVTYDIE